MNNTFMKALDVHNYFTANGLVGDFWKDIVEIDDVLYIPTAQIVNAIGSDAFRRMQCNVTTLVALNSICMQICGDWD